MTAHSRRAVLKTGAVAAAAPGLIVNPIGAAASDRAGDRHSFGMTVDFGEQYFTNMLHILESIRTTEMPLIGELTGRMADTIRKGGNVWWQAKAGHMPLGEFREENRGNPRIFRSYLKPGSGGDYTLMKPGDVLVTNYVHEDIRAARDRGVYVAGVPVNYVDNEWAPRGFAVPNQNGWLLGDVSNVILKSYIPYHQGIVDCPQVPEMKICPSSANSLAALFWMCQAETASRLKNPKAPRLEKAGGFMDTLLARMKEAYAARKEQIFDLAAAAAERIGAGAHFHVTSDHSGVQLEATVVAMGPMMLNAFRSDMRKGDVHFLATIDPDAKPVLDEARKARAMDMMVVTAGPGNSNGLRDCSDVFLDNFSPEGQGWCAVPGFPDRIGVLGGIMNNVLMWVFIAQTVDEMVRRGWVPYFWMGIYTVGGKEYNAAMHPFFLARGF